MISVHYFKDNVQIPPNIACIGCFDGVHRGHQELINKTGGVIQGMSGSPIIQDNKIIGAVTHVIVDNPVTGYGILITNMLEEGEK